MLKKITTLTTLAGTLACSLSALEKPNILVFLVDDIGYMDVGVNNPNCFYETPNIDALAKEGALFTNGYTASPIYSPTQVSMLTGKYSTRVGATNFSPKDKTKKGRSGKFNPAPFRGELPLEEVTIAEALKTVGYKTFFVGKWHLGDGPSLRPQKQGFDMNIGGHEAGGPYTGKKYFAPFKNPEIKEESLDGEHLPARLAGETSVFIKESKDEPFLAYLSFYSVPAHLLI